MFTRGGALYRTAILAVLGQVRHATAGAGGEGMRARWVLATADLANVGGWMAYDAGDYDAARRMLTYALALARRTQGDGSQPISPWGGEGLSMGSAVRRAVVGWVS